jgi:oxaloacetate decarboxylase gamma subunit
MEALKQGFIIMVIGMGTVYIFLTIMIYAMNFTKKILDIVNKYFPEEGVNEGANCKNSKKRSNNDAEIALAIAAAIHKGAVKS